MRFLTGLIQFYRRALSGCVNLCRTRNSIGYNFHSIGYNCLIFSLAIAWADDEALSYPDAPDPALFSALKAASPFQRTLNISETYALRAVATYADVAFARVYNRETNKTITMELGGEPQAGLVLKQINASEDASDLSGVSAMVAFAGEEAELKYDPAQLDPANRGKKEGGPPDGRKGMRKGGDGKRRGPSEESKQKYFALPEEKKEKFKTYIRSVMEKYPDMPREEKGNLIRGALQKLSDGGDIEVPK